MALNQSLEGFIDIICYTRIIRIYMAFVEIL